MLTVPVRRLRLGFQVLAALMGCVITLTVPLTATAAPRWSVTRVATLESLVHLHLKGEVASMEMYDDYGRGGVWIYDVGTLQPSMLGPGRNHAASDDRLVWENGDVLVTWAPGDVGVTEIELWPGMYTYSLSVDGDRIAWHASSGLDSDVYTCVVGGDVVNLSNDLTRGDAGALVSGDRVTWGSWSKYIGMKRVMSWAEGESQPTTVTPYLLSSSEEYAVDGDRIVWEDSDVYLWSPGEPEALRVTNTADSNESEPAIDGDRLAWVGFDGHDYEIYTWVIGDPSPVNVSNNDVEDRSPYVDGERVAWRSTLATGPAICVWTQGDAAPTTLATTDVRSAAEPEVSGDYVAWEGASDACFYLARFSEVPFAKSPVYRFYNFTNNTHFFTPSAEEADYVIATWPNVFRYEGIAYYTNPHNNFQPLYRFYNRVSNSHFYTASDEEAAGILATWPDVFKLDGRTYAVNPWPVGSSVPVYRFYNKSNGSHFYTASADEAAMVRATWPDVYTYENAAFWLGQ